MEEDKRLVRPFFLNSDVVQTAQQLLGKVLCTQIEGDLVKARIIETEAYDSPNDKACHAYGNKRTNRTETMFLAGGHTYVYLCYGIHHLFNVVTGPKDRAQAVLVRAVVPIEGLKVVQARRKLYKPANKLALGPGTVGQAMGLNTKVHNGLSMLCKESLVWIEDHGINIEKIHSGPRIGVDYAEECAVWPWRFWLKP